MTVPITTRSESGFFEVLARLHGHRCPMSILGARLGLAARTALDPAPGERLEARYFHQTCALDGIQLATQCTLGNGNLRVERKEEHRLLLWAEGRSAGVEAVLTPAALERGRSYTALRERAAGLPADAPGHREATEAMEGVLRGLETAPVPDLVAVRPGAPVEA